MGTTYDHGDVVYDTPSTNDPRLDYYYAIDYLKNRVNGTLDVSGEDALTMIIRSIDMKSALPIAYICSLKFKPRTISNMMTLVVQSEQVRNYCWLGVQKYAPDLKRYLFESFVSTQCTVEGVTALRDKLCRGTPVYSGNDNDFYGGLALTIANLEVSKYRMIPTIDPDIVRFLPYNPNAACGFNHMNDPKIKTKRDDAPYAMARLYDMLWKACRGHPFSADIKQYISRYSAKAEVRGPDDDKTKIRLTAMLDTFSDSLTRIITIPFQSGIQQAKPILIGTSTYTSLYYYMLKAHNHPDFERLLAYGDVPWTKRSAFEKWNALTSDESTQDGTWCNRMLDTVTQFRYLYVKTPEVNRRTIFINIAVEELMRNLSNFTLWFGNDFIRWLHHWLSGKLDTAHSNSWKTIMMFYTHIVKMCRKYCLTVAQVKEVITACSYGDDGVMFYPDRLDHLFCSSKEKNFPDLLAETYAEFGCILKPGETKIYRPKEGIMPHKDVFYTHICNDDIVSEGIHILQRYFVKYDKNMKPLHPDAEDWFVVKPWRKTSSFITKLGTDANGWEGKPGRLEGSENIWVNWYCKAFGLLMDAGPNYTAHCVIKETMRAVALDKPNLPDICQTEWRKSELIEALIKTGLDEEIIQLVSMVHKLPDKVSYTLFNSPHSASAKALLVKNDKYYPTTTLVALRRKNAKPSSWKIVDGAIRFC